MNKKRGDQLFSAVLILPTVLVTTVFILVPVIDSVIKSFLDFKVRNIILGKPANGTILKTISVCSTAVS